MIAGLDLDTDIAAMERLFVAGLCGLAYGLAEVIEAFAAHGVRSSIMIMGGGASRSPLVRQIMADTTGLTVALPQTREPVLLGAAMLGAVAGGAYASIGETMAKMSALGRKSEPTAPDMAAFHTRKREVYKLLRDVDRGSRAAMADIARG
ncbi:ribulose kinase [Bradyrhizobium ottawaense]